MTKEEAVEMLKKDKQQRGECFISEALDMAIQALEQEPCEDCISREDAIKQCGFGMTNLLIADCLRKLPPVTPQPKMGTEESSTDCISRADMLDTTICEGISCNECSFNEIDGEPGCLLHKRIDDLPSVKPKFTDEEIQKMQDLEQAQNQKAYELGKRIASGYCHWSRIPEELEKLPAVRPKERTEQRGMKYCDIKQTEMEPIYHRINEHIKELRKIYSDGRCADCENYNNCEYLPEYDGDGKCLLLSEEGEEAR